LLHHGHPVTAENVKTVFYGQEIKTHKYMLMEVFKKHNDQMAELVGLEYAPGTLERFKRLTGIHSPFCNGSIRWMILTSVSSIMSS
jgi:hypothetical protein